MRLNNNISALQAYSNLLVVNRGVSASMKRLSSGKKINSVKDDAAGTSISNKISSILRGLEVAGNNTMDGTSVVQTAEGAMQEMHNMLHRLKELAVQASNDSNEPKDREKMQDEVIELQSALKQIVDRTEFNNIKLLDGSASRMTKTTKPEIVKIFSTSDKFQVGTLEFDITSAGNPAVLKAGKVSTLDTDLSKIFEPYSIYPTNNVDKTLSIGNKLVEITAADTDATIKAKLEATADLISPEMRAQIDAFDWTTWAGNTDKLDLRTLFEPEIIKPDETIIKTITMNGETLQITKEDTSFTVIEKIKELGERLNVNTSVEDFDWNAWAAGTGKLDLRTREAGSAQKLVFTGSKDLMLVLGITDDSDLTVPIADKNIHLSGKDAVINPATLEYNGQKATYVSKGNLVEVTTATHEKISYIIKVDQYAKAEWVDVTDPMNPVTHPQIDFVLNDIDATLAVANVEIEALDFGPLKIQVGANKGDEMELNIPSITLEGLKIMHLNLMSLDRAQEALTRIDEATAKVSEVRSRLGAYQNRMEYTANSLDATILATSTSLSRILDTDMAWEMTKLTQNQVINQAGIAILGQANQRPEEILQLLR